MTVISKNHILYYYFWCSRIGFMGQIAASNSNICVDLLLSSDVGYESDSDRFMHMLANDRPCPLKGSLAIHRH